MAEREGNVEQRGWIRGVRMVTCALMFAAVLGGGSAGVAGQETAGQTPAAGALVGQEGSQQPGVTPTPVVGSTSGQLQGQAAPQPTAAATEQLPAAPSGPVASGADGDTAPPVLAQGLVYLTGANVIWQVREVQLSGAETATGNARVILQRSGVTIVRNDVTGKRTRLEPGEAYFAAANDPYTTMPDGNSPSTVWVFELSHSNQVGPGAFYLSPDVAGYPEAVYDLEFTRYVVPAGESVDFMGGDGPSLMVVLSGAADVTLKSDVAALKAKDGLVVDGSAVIAATGSEAVVVTVTLGPKVSDTSAAPPAAPASAATQAATGQEASAAGTDTPAPQPAQANGDNGAFVTSIKVGAVESVGITMYADGELVFDGWLNAGEWTDFYTGSTFEVYTTSGANTLFQNTCSTEPFWMDQEPGESHYVLQAGPSSCAPVG
jgi:hypothetical protein